MKRLLKYVVISSLMILITGCSSKSAASSDSKVVIFEATENPNVISEEKQYEKNSDDSRNVNESMAVNSLMNKEFRMVNYSNSKELVNAMGVGWNLGNTFDCFSESKVHCTETSWGNPVVTRELIQSVAAYGYKSIRIPITWLNHMDETEEYIIDESWMNRIEQVVNWCLEEKLIVIINLHHDGGGSEDSWIRQFSKDYTVSLERFQKVWLQIAERFADYPDTLLFESMNEVGYNDIALKEAYSLYNTINQEFVNLIRKSGGNNENRYVLIPGYWADIEKTCNVAFTMPNDERKRCILSVHYCKPETFTKAKKDGSSIYSETWGTEEDYNLLVETIQKLKINFVDEGIPVVIDEFGMITKEKEESSVVLYLKAVTETALEYQCCPMLWDDGSYIDRTTYMYKIEGLNEAMSQVINKTTQ